jgi:hypothetical protein
MGCTLSAVVAVIVPVKFSVDLLLDASRDRPSDCPFMNSPTDMPAENNRRTDGLFTRENAIISNGSEVDMGLFSETQPNPTHHVMNPTQPDPPQQFKSQPNPTQPVATTGSCFTKPGKLLRITTNSNKKWGLYLIKYTSSKTPHRKKWITIKCTSNVLFLVVNIYYRGSTTPSN